MVREIGGEKRTALLAAHDAKGFECRCSTASRLPAGAATSTATKSKDGAIRCKAGKGGNLFTEGRRYGDFTVRLQFRLPPGGNNGLAIRYPGEGDPAYAGFELQVLDDSAPQYTTLKPYQYHGSVYGVVPSHRGYQRPVGEWNFEEVTVRGSHFTVDAERHHDRRCRHQGARVAPEGPPRQGPHRRPLRLLRPRRSRSRSAACRSRCSTR
jgi:hypothetical protein